MSEPTAAQVQFARCPEVLKVCADVPQEAQCALYEGHLDAHETEPLPPSREDKSDGIHQHTWRLDEDGIPTDVQQLRIGTPDDEEETADA